MADIFLRTRPGVGASFSTSLTRDPVGASVTVEFSNTSGFKTVVLTKNPTIAGREVSVSLTPSEVDTLKDSYFRVKWVKGQVTKFLVIGQIDYVQASSEHAVAFSQFVTRVHYDSTWPSRPSVPVGMVEWVGPGVPDGILPGDTLVRTD